jgi:two-component system sensor histidine kinase HydH
MRATDTAELALALVASAAFLAIAALAVSRGRRDAMGLRLALLCLDLFAYDISQLIKSLTPDRGWNWMNAATASLAPALFYDLVITFVARRRALRFAVIVSYMYFGLVAVACVSPVLVASMDRFPGGDSWAIAMLAGMAPVVVHGSWLLNQHRVGASPPERARTRLVLSATLIAAISNASDLVQIAGAQWSFRMGTWGLVASAGLLAITAVRTPLFERVSILTASAVVAIALAVVFAEVSVFRWVGGRTALATAATVIVVTLALVASRFVVTEYAEHRERTLAHASLGRMAAQMAHDIKNPLAAIRGAAQFLVAERDAHRSIDEQREFLDLLVQQCDRLGRIVDQYHRIGRAQPELASIDLNDAVLESTKFIGSKEAQMKLAESLPRCDADKDLLVIALENVLRNAHEAAPEKAIHVETGSTAHADANWVFVAIRDEGPGMDPRTRERALEGFFTTKSQGSGLGLTFVRRVVEAHRGRLEVESREGVGTTVRIELRAST